MTKIVSETERIHLSEPFSFGFSIERIVGFEDLMLANEVVGRERGVYLDSGLYMKGRVSPFLAKFTQIDYLDIMDCVYFNLTFDDKREA